MHIHFIYDFFAAESIMWDLEPSLNQSGSGHDGDEDANHDDEAQHSVTEDKDMYRQDIESEPLDRYVLLILDK